MVANARQEVAEAIRERTGEDVTHRLHDECLARYEALDEGERRQLIETASEYVLALQELSRVPETERAEARDRLETVKKLLLSPHLAAVTTEFTQEVSMLRRVGFPEEYPPECPIKFPVNDLRREREAEEDG